MGRRQSLNTITTVPIGNQVHPARQRPKHGRLDNIHLCVTVYGTLLAILVTGIIVYVMIAVVRQGRDELDDAIGTQQVQLRRHHKEITNRIQLLEDVIQQTFTNLTDKLTKVTFDNRVFSISSNASGLCSSESTWFQDHCYKIFDVELSWMEAKEYCRTRNSDLAAIDDKQTQQFLKDKLTKGPYEQQDFWIGGSDTDKDGRFVWTDRQNKTRPVSRYTSWHIAQPDNKGNSENCIDVKQIYGWNWNDEDCYRKCGFICQGP